MWFLPLLKVSHASMTVCSSLQHEEMRREHRTELDAATQTVASLKSRLLEVYTSLQERSRYALFPVLGSWREEIDPHVRSPIFFLRRLNASLEAELEATRREVEHCRVGEAVATEVALRHAGGAGEGEKADVENTLQVGARCA